MNRHDLHDYQRFCVDFMKYLIETRCSGGLTKPYSAVIVTEETEAPDEEEGGDDVNP